MKANMTSKSSNGSHIIEIYLMVGL